MKFGPIVPLAVLALVLSLSTVSAEESQTTTNRIVASQGGISTPVVADAPSIIGRLFTHANGKATHSVRGNVWPMSGEGGFHIGVSGLAEALPYSTWQPAPAGPYGVIGVTGHGVSGVPDGRAWGGNFHARAWENHTNGDLTGVEINMDTRVPVGTRYGLSIIGNSTGLYGASGQDAMIRMTNQANGAPWKDGILFANCCGVFPIRTDGALLRTEGQGTIGKGIDISSVDITGAALATPNGLEIAGAGYIDVPVIERPIAPPEGKARLYVDVDDHGNTRLMVRFATGAPQMMAYVPPQ